MLLLKMENSNTEYEEAKFWKKSIKAVPGRPFPRIELRKLNKLQQNLSLTSFHDLEMSGNRIWEIENYEYSSAIEVNISKQVVPTAILRTTDNCSSRNLSSQLSVGSNSDSKSSNIESYLVSLEKQKAPVVSGCTTQRLGCTTIKTLQSEDLCRIIVDEGSEALVNKVTKFKALINATLLNLDDLRHLSWSGVPSKERPIAWRLLAGYLPASLECRHAVSKRKRLDYWNLVKMYFNTHVNESYQDTYKQIQIDIPRMSPLITLVQQEPVQGMFERILFIWSIRHPASGYVQGINDLIIPFFVVFLKEFLASGKDLYTLDMSTLQKEHRDIIEADSFWCLSTFLNGIQDNYIFAQLGIQHKIKQLKELIQRIDSVLHNHLERHGVDYLLFSFRWMNNLLMREIPLQCSIRLWDTYLAESDNFASFHLYVCAAFLLQWHHHLLLQKDFQGLMFALQNLPTHDWNDTHIGVLVAKAYQLKSLFADAPNHLKNSENVCSGK